jgi:O-antigen ligase
LFKWLPALFLGLAVFLRHRSVWAALAAGILSFLVVDRGLFRRLIPLAALAICIAAGYALLSRSAVPTVEDQFTDSATDERTWLWRLANWQAQLERSQTVSGALFGTPLGGEWEVFDVTTRRYENVPPHNEYLLEYLSVGVSGVVLVLCFTIRPLRRFWRLSLTDMKAVEPSASAWVAVIIAIIVYGVPYTQQVDTYALLAIANAMVSRLDKDAITATAVPSVPR